MATDTYTGSAVALATHDANWTSGPVDPVSDLGIDGSGFCKATSNFSTSFTYYAGGGATDKSEIVVPIGAFATLTNAGEYVGAFCNGGAASRGLNFYINSALMTGAVINAVRVASDTNFLTNQTLSPTIDTSVTVLTISIQRTSATNANLIVNGTTYPINTTGFDISTGFPGIIVSTNSSTPVTTLKLDSWTNGVASAVPPSRLLLLGVS